MFVVYRRTFCFWNAMVWPKASIYFHSASPKTLCWKRVCLVCRLVYNENQNTLFSIIIKLPKLGLKPGLEGY